MSEEKKKKKRSKASKPTEAKTDKSAKKSAKAKADASYVEKTKNLLLKLKEKNKGANAELIARKLGLINEESSAEEITAGTRKARSYARKAMGDTPVQKEGRQAIYKL